MKHYRTVIFAEQWSDEEDCYKTETTVILEQDAQYLRKDFYKSTIQWLYMVAEDYKEADFFRAYLTADGRYIGYLSLIPNLRMADGHEHTYLSIHLDNHDVERLRDRINN